MKHMHGELDTTMPDILILHPMLNLQVVYLIKLRSLNFPCDIIKFFAKIWCLEATRLLSHSAYPAVTNISCLHNWQTFQRQQPTQKNSPRFEMIAFPVVLFWLYAQRSRSKWGFGKRACVFHESLSHERTVVHSVYPFFVNFFISITHNFST